MPRKNGNARQPRQARAPQAPPTATPAARVRTAAEDSLWGALHDQPGATTTELSAAAGIGKSTAGKILARWAGEGSVTRTAGIAEHGRRTADRWTITNIDTTEPAAAEPTETVDPTEPANSGAAPESDDSGSATDSATDTATDRGAGSGAGEKAPRLAPGALRGMVEDYLREHRGEQFSPNAIGKALNRSSGAVNNALDKLVADGYAVQSQERPKRFAFDSTN